MNSVVRRLSIYIDIGTYISQTEKEYFDYIIYCVDNNLYSIKVENNTYIIHKFLETWKKSKANNYYLFDNDSCVLFLLNRKYKTDIKKLKYG